MPTLKLKDSILTSTEKCYTKFYTKDAVMKPRRAHLQQTKLLCIIHLEAVGWLKMTELKPGTDGWADRLVSCQ